MSSIFEQVNDCSNYLKTNFFMNTTPLEIKFNSLSTQKKASPNTKHTVSDRVYVTFYCKFLLALSEGVTQLIIIFVPEVSCTDNWAKAVQNQSVDKTCLHSRDLVPRSRTCRPIGRFGPFYPKGQVRIPL